MRVAINGYGRIGRSILRAAMLRKDCAKLEFVAINELASPDAIDYLTQYDSTHGRFPGQVILQSGHLLLKTHFAKVNAEIFNQSDSSLLPWKERVIDLVLECSGGQGNLSSAAQHLTAGANRVLLSQPGEADIPAIVYGVNHTSLDANAEIVSAASCTSNALISCISVIQQEFGIENGVITTIHASMHDQPVIDAYHSNDLRKNRAASQSIIPVDTALATGVARILPELEGRFVAHALRVPVNNVSALNVTLNLQSDVTVEGVNAAIKIAAEGALSGVLGYTEEPLASCDYNGDPRSGIVDARQTVVSGNKTVNLFIWFDNEWAFANRMLDIALYMSLQ